MKNMSLRLRKPFTLILFSVSFLSFSSVVWSAGWIKDEPSYGNCCMHTRAEMVLDAHGYPISVVSHASNATVQKRNPNTGDLIWSYKLGYLPKNVVSESSAIALDKEGNVIVAGAITTTDSSTPSQGIVVKLNGSSGQEIWRWIGATGKPSIVVEQVFFDVLVDGQGDVYGFGSRWSNTTKRDLYAVRISGKSGNALWEYVENGGNVNEPGNMWWESFVEADFDNSGNVIAAGTLMHPDPNAQDWNIVVKRLDMSTGSANWSFQFDDTDQEIAMAMSRLSDGSIAVAAGAYSTGYVFKVTPGNNQADWQYNQPYLYPYNWTYDLAVANNDDVFYGGELDTFGQVMGRIDGNTGAGLWTQTINNGSVQQSASMAIAAGADGNLYSVGYVHNDQDGHKQMHLAKLEGNSGAIFWQTKVPVTESSPSWSRLRDVQIDSSASTLFAVGTEGGHSNALNSLWSRTLSVPTSNGDLPTVFEHEDIFLIPLWDNWLLWLIPVDDIEQMERERALLVEQGQRPGFQVTHSLDDLERSANQAWYLIADSRGNMIRELASDTQRFSKRTAPATLYVQRDSYAFEIALRLFELQTLDAGR